MNLFRLPLTLLLIATLGGALATPAALAAPSKSKERNLDATFSLDISAPPGAALPTTNALTMWVPKGVRNAGNKMPFCNPAEIEARGVTVACPMKSFVGQGKASGFIQFVSQSAIEPMTVTLINGPNNTLLARVRGTNPVSIDVTIQSVITKPGGKYGMQLYFPFPDSLIHPVPGSTASVLHMDAHLDGKVGWLRSTSCPPSGWSLGAMLGSVDGGTTKISADLACR